MTVHIVGAGLAGLSAALRTADAGLDVVLHEAQSRPGGRCQSWFDPVLERVIDNGSHLAAGGNRALFRFLSLAGAGDRLTPVDGALVLTDLESGRSWPVRPLTLLPSIIAALPALFSPSDATVADRLGRSRHWRDFWEPFTVSALNTPAKDASARLLQAVLARTLWRGMKASSPYRVRESLSDSFITPALDALNIRGGTLRLGHPLRAIDIDGAWATGLIFDDEEIRLSRHDRVILATPWRSARRLLPMIPNLPGETIVNAYFRLDGPPPIMPANGMLGLIGGDAHWLFLRGDVLSVTVSAASALAERPVGEIAERLWRDCAKALKLERPLPAFRVVRQARATLFHSPSADRRRPAPEILDNLTLAGDWIATGLPCTMEGAVLSGERAARRAMLRS
ncbi:MAG: FAD-dependent oxidoreductase [Rhodospirillaceae bacterium]|nr:FAD-dependent oxidoreductase [Rhodospirillaceae bacterium]